MSNIDKTAIVSSNAVIGENVKIGPYAIVEDNVVIGDNSVIEAHAKVCFGARIGKGCKICSFAVVSGEPQDLHFDSSLETFTEIGDGSVLREHVSVHRATFEGKSTIIGKNCFLMDGAHVGHDCVVADNVIIANFSALGGHVHIDKDTFISGGVMIHQRQRVGEGVIVSGNSACSLDVPPFVIAFERNKLAGLNLIGMSRRGMSRDEVSEVKSLYNKVYSSMSARKNALAILEVGDFKTDAGRRFLEFFKMENRRYSMPREEK
ncbi:MAG: acyl-ACP--UDP-N-acetylglucosamine O-acyltransferase [Verrucomicrobiaceae bacterium]|nr:acyl-ACP--UDP-N-acetylglucosamine O-acyltransferase [Verrucomicrobiaceae bacterium]